MIPLALREEEDKSSEREGLPSAKQCECNIDAQCVVLWYVCQTEEFGATVRRILFMSIESPPSPRIWKE